MAFEIILVLLIVILIILYFRAIKKILKLEKNIRSVNVKHGYQFESFVPFMKNYPGEKENSVFIGKPVDFISFDQNNIKFIEVKTGKSMLNEKQRRIKELVLNKKVEWHELRFEK